MSKVMMAIIAGGFGLICAMLSWIAFQVSPGHESPTVELAFAILVGTIVGLVFYSAFTSKNR